MKARPARIQFSDVESCAGVHLVLAPPSPTVARGDALLFRPLTGGGRFQSALSISFARRRLFLLLFLSPSPSYSLFKKAEAARASAAVPEPPSWRAGKAGPGASGGPSRGAGFDEWSDRGGVGEIWREIQGFLRIVKLADSALVVYLGGDWEGLFQNLTIIY